MEYHSGRKEGDRRERGFTVIELMVALSIAGVLIVLTYQAYKAQQRTYLVQQQIVEMQQNLRAASWILTRELRMAGYDASTGDPTKDSSCNLGGSGASVEPGILAVTSTRLDFSRDQNGDGDCADNDEAAGGSENLTFMTYLASDGEMKIGRRDNNATVPALQAIAQGFDQIDFNFLDGGGGTTADLDKIRSVEISLLAHGGTEDLKLVDKQTYTFPSGATFTPTLYPDPSLQPDSARRHRRQLTTLIRCRNLGLGD